MTKRLWRKKKIVTETQLIRHDVGREKFVSEDVHSICTETEGMEVERRVWGHKNKKASGVWLHLWIEVLLYLTKIRCENGKSNVFSVYLPSQHEKL